MILCVGPSLQEPDRRRERHVKKRIEMLAWRKLVTNSIDIYGTQPEIFFSPIQYTSPIVRRIEPCKKRL
jgi:hypothetical protein